MGNLNLVCENKKCSNLDKDTGFCKVLTQEDGLNRRVTCEERIWADSSDGRAKD